MLGIDVDISYPISSVRFLSWRIVYIYGRIHFITDAIAYHINIVRIEVCIPFILKDLHHSYFFCLKRPCFEWLSCGNLNAFIILPHNHLHGTVFKLVFETTHIHPGTEVYGINDLYFLLTLLMRYFLIIYLCFKKPFFIS